jgi:hypothetical protein
MRANVAGLLGCLFLVGCSGGGWRDHATFQPPPAPPDLATADKLEISAGFAGGIPGAPASRYTWELRKGGPCRGTVHHGDNMSSAGGVTTEYELPPGAFEECRALLQEVSFWSMKSAEPEFRFESSGSSVKVACGGQEHLVTVTSPAPAPAGYQKLYDYLTEGLVKRGRKVERPGKDGPPREGR